MNTLYAIIGFCVVTALLTYIGIRNRAKSWRGVVTDIKRSSYIRNDVLEEEIVVRYRTDAGKSGKMRLNTWAFGKYFPGLKVGDTLVKVAGEGTAKKEPSAAKPA